MEPLDEKPRSGKRIRVGDDPVADVVHELRDSEMSWEDVYNRVSRDKDLGFSESVDALKKRYYRAYPKE